MAHIIYLQALAVAYESYMNRMEAELNENDGLLARLEHDEVNYALHNRQRLDISSLSDEVCKSLFRFTFEQLKTVSRALGLPEEVTFRAHTRQQFSFDRNLALAIMLRRLAYPSRLVDLELLFGIDKSTIGVVFNGMIELLSDNYEEKVVFNAKHLHSFNLRRFADATKEKGEYMFLYLSRIKKK